jgi:SAM-dependent methyltransferase
LLDLGCGYGEFINQIQCAKKFAMDLNPEAPSRVAADVQCLLQDCSTTWALPDNSLDVIFTSNFFEHLPDKGALTRTLTEARRCLKPGGRLIALGPNIKLMPGAYWEFCDHYLPLTENSLAEAMRNCGFAIQSATARFLPYTMANGREYPLLFVKIYLRVRLAWWLFGKQFLVVAAK